MGVNRLHSYLPICMCAAVAVVVVDLLVDHSFVRSPKTKEEKKEKKVKEKRKNPLTKLEENEK